MAIILVAISIALRYISPHSIFPSLSNMPFVPVATALMFVGTAIGSIRRTVTPRLMWHWIIQWILFGWAFLTLLINARTESTTIFTSNYFRDLLYITIIFLVIDRLSHLKIFLATTALCLACIGVLALPQTWGEKMCAEWKEGDSASAKFDGRKCQSVNECYVNQPKERLFPGVGARLYRCERSGLLGIPALIGRIHWVATFSDSNNLAAALAWIVPLIIGWLGKSKRRWNKIISLLFTFLIGVSIIATGSRGGQLAFMAGLIPVIWYFWGKKIVILVGGVAILSLGVIFATGKLQLRDESNYSSSATVSDKYRREAMATGFRLWGDYPFFGVGYRRFENYHLIDPHNSFLCAAGELGTLGMLLYSFGLWALLKGTLQVLFTARHVGHSQLERLAVGYLGAFAVVFIAMTMFLSTYDKLSWLMFVAATIGMLRSAEHELPTLKLKFSYWDFLGLVPIVMLLMGMLYLGVMTSYSLSLY